MPNIILGQHFDRFVQEQLASGRFQSERDVIEAGLRLLEDQNAVVKERRADLCRTINEAFDDPRPSIPATDVFARLRAHHTEQEQAGQDGG